MDIYVVAASARGREDDSTNLCYVEDRFTRRGIEISGVVTPERVKSTVHGHVAALVTMLSVASDQSPVTRLGIRGVLVIQDGVELAVKGEAWARPVDPVEEWRSEGRRWRCRVEVKVQASEDPSCFSAEFFPALNRMFTYTRTFELDLARPPLLEPGDVADSLIDECLVKPMAEIQKFREAVFPDEREDVEDLPCR